MTDYYDVLDVSRDATQADIERAYRQKVKEYHPDVSDHPKAAERFQAVTDAEEVLGDEHERERYDRLGHEGYLRVVEDGVPEEHVESTDDAAAGDERSRGAGGGRSGGGAGRSDRTRSRGGRSGSGGLGDAARQATGPAAGSDNPSQRSYSPWSSDDDGGGVEADTEEWWNETVDDDDPLNQHAPGNRRRSGGPTATGASAGPAETARRRRKRARAGGAASDDSFWSAEVDPDVEPKPEPSAIERALGSREGTLFTVSLLFIYPVFVYFSVTPSLPLGLNLLIGLATATVATFMLTEPGISLIVFGVWGLLSPLLLAFLGVGLFTMHGLFVLGAFWLPLGLSFVMALAMPS